VDLVSLEHKEYHVASAKTLKEDKELLKAELNMSPSETDSKSITRESKLEVIDYDDRDKSFMVKSPKGHVLRISDTFAEM
jgi:hypothetical protein